MKSFITPSEVRFRLPGVPPSVNAIYSIIHAQRKVYMKPEVRKYKNDMKMIVPLWRTVEGNEVLGMEVGVYRDWYYKKGTMMRLDVQNMGKVLVDLIAEKMGFNDCQIWQFGMKKVQDWHKEFVEVRLWRVEKR